MARIRTVKPEFFRHRRLFLAEKKEGFPLRLAFAGLWTVADREGRFRWEPDEIKLDCLPYDDVDFSAVLDALVKHGFVLRYTVSGREYGCIPGWERHQCINTREAKSTFPAPPDQKSEDAQERTCMHVQVSDASRELHARVTETDATRHVHAQGEGKGREEEGKEVLPSRTSANTSQGAGADPTKDVVKAFMAARNERWPNAIPANNAMTQAEHARAMLALPGATVELVCELVRDAVKNWKDPNPPGGVGAFKTSIPNQIARHVRAGTIPDQPRSGRPTAEVRDFVPVDRNSTLRARLQSYKRDGQWPYGDPAPTSQYCQIDRRLMREVLGEEFMAQHHASQAMPMRATQ